MTASSRLSTGRSSVSGSRSRDVTPAKPLKDRESRLSASKKTPSPDNPRLKKGTPSPVESRRPSIGATSRLATARKPRLSTSSSSSASSTPGSTEKLSKSRSPLGRATPESSSVAKKDTAADAKGPRAGVTRLDSARARGRGRVAPTRGALGRGTTPRAASTTSSGGSKASSTVRGAKPTSGTS